MRPSRKVSIVHGTLVVLLHAPSLSPPVARQARGGLGVVADDAEIDCRELNVMRITFVGVHSDEVGRHLRALPDRLLVEVAVERDGRSAFADALGGNDAPCLRGRRINCWASSRRWDQQCAEEQAD